MLNYISLLYILFWVVLYNNNKKTVKSACIQPDTKQIFGISLCSLFKSEKQTLHVYTSPCLYGSMSSTWSIEVVLSNTGGGELQFVVGGGGYYLSSKNCRTVIPVKMFVMWIILLLILKYCLIYGAGGDVCCQHLCDTGTILWTTNIKWGGGWRWSDSDGTQLNLW